MRAASTRTCAARSCRDHEIRALGSRICLASNITEEAISPLMTRADQQVTKIYTQGGEGALRPEHYKTVEAPLSLTATLAKAV